MMGLVLAIQLQAVFYACMEETERGYGVDQPFEVLTGLSPVHLEEWLEEPARPTLSYFMWRR